MDNVRDQVSAHWLSSLNTCKLLSVTILISQRIANLRLVLKQLSSEEKKDLDYIEKET